MGFRFRRSVKIAQGGCGRIGADLCRDNLECAGDLTSIHRSFWPLSERPPNLVAGGLWSLKPSINA
jgi:hypothetical protein